MKGKALGWMLLIGLGSLLLISMAAPPVMPAAQPAIVPTATPVGTPVPELILTLTYNRLDKPRVSTPSTQADQGAVYYWLVCIPCHGDKGQGLTDEWREVFGPEEKNCWQAKCHGKRHPDDGFELPHAAPPVLGPTALDRFNNAEELHRLIATSMPWYRPSFMTEEQSWQVTAFLLRQQGVMPPKVILNEGNAPVFRLRTPAPALEEERPLTAAAIGLLTVAVVGVVWHYRKRSR
jgi:mono/diheme cytochrome c family protein